MWHTLAHFFGLDNASGGQYLFWSGVEGDITQLAVIVIGWRYLRHHNCAVRGCWRVSHRKIPGTDHIVCRRHHPNPKSTLAQILEDHRRAGSQ